MIKIFLMLALIATVFTQNSFAKGCTKTQPAQLLDAYHKLKDALVSGNATLAAANADELAKIINGIDKQTINDDTRASLLKDAGAMAQSKDIHLQREKFATLSNNMFELAKKNKAICRPGVPAILPHEKSIMVKQ